MSPVNTSSAVKLHLVEQHNDTAQIQAHTPALPRRDVNRLLHLYIPADIIALIFGFLCAWGVADIINSAFFGRGVMGPLSVHGSMRMAEFLMISAAVLVWFQHTDHYRLRMPFWLEIKKITSVLGLAMMADGFFQFASKEDFSRLWLISGWAMAAMFMIGLRNFLRAYLRRHGLYQVRTMLVGGGETAQQTRAALQCAPCLGYEITAHIKDLPAAFMQAGKSWKDLTASHDVDYVMIALDGQELSAAEQPLSQLVREALPFSISPPLGHLPVMGMVPQYFFNHDVMLLARNSGLEQPLPCLLKRSMDIIVSATAMLVLSPLMIAIALQIKKDGGPALFGHSRLGRNGKSFSCLKFRSMVMNGEEVLTRHLAENIEAQHEWNTTYKLRNDPRVTKLGDFLRKSSLDELPQLINVLRGDMSLVGPRPIVTDEVSRYDGDIAHYYRVRPGVTGLWQVSGRSDVSYPQRVHMDSWYVRNWSLWHDIAILCKTFPALLKRSGAY